MKISTAVRKAAKNHYLSPMGDQWMVVHKHPEGYTTSSNSTWYTQAVQWRKEAVAQEALELIGFDNEDSMIVSFVSPEGSALELAERAMQKLQEIA